MRYDDGDDDNTHRRRAERSQDSILDTDQRQPLTNLVGKQATRAASRRIAPAKTTGGRARCRSIRMRRATQRSGRAGRHPVRLTGRIRQQWCFGGIEWVSG
jgi:hypothetical protein